MAKIKALINLLDTFFLGIWGLTVMDLVPLIQNSVFSDIDNWIKTLMALAGLIYFLITIPYKLKNLPLERRMKEQQLKKLERENELDDEFTKISR